MLNEIYTKAILAIGRVTKYCEALDDPTQYGGYASTESLERSNLVSSEIGPGVLPLNGYHAPVLDLDYEAHLVPSSTPGHFHLFLDKPLTWLQYKRVLEVLGEVGLIEEGYAKASIARGHSAVRLPGQKRKYTRKELAIMREKAGANNAPNF